MALPGWTQEDSHTHTLTGIALATWKQLYGKMFQVFEVGHTRSPSPSLAVGGRVEFLTRTEQF